MPSLGVLLFWHLACIAPLLCSALSIRTIEPYNTDRPYPGVILFFETSGTRSSSDPQRVDVLLRDTQRGNFTLVFGDHDIVKDADAGFEIPSVPPGSNYAVRMVDAGTTRVLADSQQFQIYSVGTPPSSTYGSSSSTTSGTITPSASTSPVSTPSPTLTAFTSQGANSSATPSPGLPIGPIIGGAVGGVVILIVIIILLYLLFRQRKSAPKAPAVKKPGPNDVISPFIVRPANAGDNASSTDTSSAFQSSSSRSRPTVRSGANEKARLAARMGDTLTSRNMMRPLTEGTSSTSTADTASHRRAASSSTDHPATETSGALRVRKDSKGSRELSRARAAALRTEQLRRERERIDREIAELEMHASREGSSTTSRYAGQGDDAVLRQISSLRDQMRRMEQRQVPADEPPPEYHATPTSSSRPNRP